MNMIVAIVWNAMVLAILTSFPIKGLRVVIGLPIHIHKVYRVRFGSMADTTGHAGYVAHIRHCEAKSDLRVSPKKSSHFCLPVSADESLGETAGNAF